MGRGKENERMRGKRTEGTGKRDKERKREVWWERDRDREERKKGSKKRIDGKR